MYAIGLVTLKKHYDFAVDTEAKELVKIELDWDYE